MKKIISFGILLLCLVNVLSAQEAQLKWGTFRVKLKMLDGTKVKGIMKSIEGDQMSIRLKGSKRVGTYSFQDIKRIKVRRVGMPFAGALVGGLASGFISASVQGDNISSSVEGAAHFFLFVGATFLGTVVGTVGGSLYRWHKIDGDRERFEKFKRKYLKRSRQ